MVLCLIVQCFAGIFYPHFEVIDFLCDDCLPSSRLQPVLSKMVTAFSRNHPESSNMKKEFESLFTPVGYITRPEVVTMLSKDFTAQAFVPKEVMFYCLRF
jgi:hypothetical protein